MIMKGKMKIFSRTDPAKYQHIANHQIILRLLQLILLLILLEKAMM
ncbi:hypothetical protein TSAR_010937 [Trichomalopsis sarcophagae]|uniref:Uncharacterized protein n=1 Tax=Trichomalopsis sarcophagae TaxID=543379 RepID=A0A232ED61_9HYME|nr:hypothetical protein TSAR_010937 [Trichomalopsis sarcophagae]